jgi:hypothetical protein
VQLLPGAAAALGLGAAVTDSPFAAQHGLYWLLDHLVAEAPVVLVIDDAHWADTATLHWVVYLARRVEGLAIAVLMGWGLGEPEADVASLEALRAEPVTVTLAPACCPGKPARR